MRNLLVGILAAVCLVATTARAEQSATFGDYTVHYVAFTTDILTPEVAKSYRIQRSKNRVLLNVSVLKKLMGTTGQPVRASIKATAINLNAQLRELEVRELNDQSAIYYVSETTVVNEETLKFTIRVLPEGLTEPLSVSFEQQFFTE